LERTSLGEIEAGRSGLRLGALVRMSDAAQHPVILRDYPLVAQSLVHLFPRRQLCAMQQAQSRIGLRRP
jgi:hypothetical protein